MKRLVRSIFATTVCGIIFLSTVVVNATGNPTVIYDGKQKEFTIINVTDTDLFPLYKNLIPGDNIEQTIDLKMENLETTTSIYLSAECEEEVRRALEGTTLDIYSGAQLIVKNKIVFDDILLGEYDKKTSETLTAIIHIPTSYGNEISEQKNKIQWVFKAQENPTTNNNPQTGDDFNILIYIAIIIMTIGIIIVVLKKKKEKPE